jgi:Na+/H+-dicarboxylate symporter
MRKANIKISQTALILAGTVGGIVFGSIVGPWAANLKFIGDIFIRLIQMSVVLLVMTAISAAVGNLDSKGAGRMSLHTFKWIILFTVLSALLGLFLGSVIKPGAGIMAEGGNSQIASAATNTGNATTGSGAVATSTADTTAAGNVPFKSGSGAVATTTADTTATGNAPVESISIQDTILGFVPSNIIGAMSHGEMIPCILFAVIFGLALGAYTRSPAGSRNIIELVNGLNAVMMNIIKIVMNIAPIGIFCLLADVSGTVGFKVVIPMFKFLGALLIGDLIQMIAYGALTCAFCRVNPLEMPKKFVRMSVIALTTTSSAICLPIKMEDTVTKFGVSRRVTDFTGPITMSMNSCGAVQCYVIAILFMSQSTGVTLSPHQLMMAILLSCLMCMGTIVVPGGMVITYTFLATSLGLPLESIAILIGIDWFSGMFRTIMNVDVDVLVAMLVASKLGELDRNVYNVVKTKDRTAEL